nr:diguanylate cyclase [uncultured Acetobacterium sp.]
MISEDAKTLMNYIKALINDEQLDTLPEKFVEDDEFQELDQAMREIRDFSLALGKGNLSHDIYGSGIVEKSIESFQKQFKYFASKAYDIIPQGLSISDKLSFDFSNIFDSMNQQIEHSIKKFTESYENFEMIFRNIPDATVIISMQDRKVIAVNQTFLEITGLIEEEVINQHVNILQLGMSDTEFNDAYDEFEQRKYYKNIETTYKNKLNEEFFWNISLKIITIGGAESMLTVIRDVTAIKELEKKLRESEERHRLLIDNAGDIISTVNLKGEFTYISPSVEKITGYTVDEVINHYQEINYFLPDALKVMKKTLEIINRMVKSGQHFDAVQFEQRQFHKDGTPIFTDTIMSGIYDEQNQFKEILGVTRDITEKVKLRDEIIKLSETDKLTQLYNRYKLDDALEREFKRSKRTQSPFAVILLDIDHFKQVNDIFGHQAGDVILKELADAFKKSIRATDIVGRWGGEEFIFILPDTNEAGAMLLAEKIRMRISATHFSHPEKITGSLGVSVYRGDSAAGTIISRADQALYAAKHHGRNQVRMI